jgi:UDP-N-acetyl-2-amino-2-deoxyglucuronate dehydrogenase
MQNDMSSDKLKTAVLGLKDGGDFLLETAARSQYFDIVAVAEKETELAENAAKQYGCLAFDDYRQFIIQNEFDCILAAAGMYSCEQHFRLAIKKKFHIFKLKPLSRNFEEASETVRLAKAEGVELSVAVPLRFAEISTQLKKTLDENIVEQLSLVTVVCEYRREHRPAWYNDPQLAGGGVLLREGYEIVDLLVQTFGVPEIVYSLMTNTASDRQQRHALTEDSAVVTMRYASDLCVNLIVTRAFGPESEIENIRCVGREKVMILDRTKTRLENRAGEKLKQKRLFFDANEAMKKSLENFALSILEPQENKLLCSGQEQLKNMAVIEAAYLSSRTLMPEQPRRILALEETEPGLFWSAGR